MSIVKDVRGGVDVLTVRQPSWLGSNGSSWSMIETQHVVTRYHFSSQKHLHACACDDARVDHRGDTDHFITASCYLQCFHLVLESLVFRLQVLRAMLGLTQLGFKLGLQLPAALLKLQQLLLSLLEAVRTPKEIKGIQITRLGVKACWEELLPKLIFLSCHCTADLLLQILLKI